MGGVDLHEDEVDLFAAVEGRANCIRSHACRPLPVSREGGGVLANNSELAQQLTDLGANIAGARTGPGGHDMGDGGCCRDI